MGSGSCAGNQRPLQRLGLIAAAATARLIENDAERLRASGIKPANQYAAFDGVDARRVLVIFVKAYSGILAFDTFVPLVT